MSTEADKDEGIDEIVKMNIPPEDKVHYIADLAKHRGRCMDEDAKVMKQQNDTIARLIHEQTMILLELQARSPIDNFMIWLNTWAKS